MFLPVLAVLGSIVSLTVGTSYGKALFETIGAGGTAAYRVVFAAIILMCVWRPWRFAVTAADRWAIVRYGITIGVMNFFFYQAINRLPEDKAEEISDFADFVSKRYEDHKLTESIQKMVSNADTFSFLEEEEEIYTVNDLKQVYND